MKVKELMSAGPRTCAPDQMLYCAAKIMCEGQWGVVPVIDAKGGVVGMVTDRDICIAAFEQNRLLCEIPISSLAMKPVVTVRADQTVEDAESLMQKHQLRRLAVVDEHDHIVGVLSIGDLVRAGRKVNGEEIIATLAAIARPSEVAPAT